MSYRQNPSRENQEQAKKDVAIHSTGQIFTPPCIHVTHHMVLQVLLKTRVFLTPPMFSLTVGFVFGSWKVGRSDRVSVLSMCLYGPLCHFHHYHKKGCHGLLAGQGGRETHGADLEPASCLQSASQGQPGADLLLTCRNMNQENDCFQPPSFERFVMQNYFNKTYLTTHHQTLVICCC